MAGNQKKIQQIRLIHKGVVAPHFINTANGGKNKAMIHATIFSLSMTIQLFWVWLIIFRAYMNATPAIEIMFIYALWSVKTLSVVEWWFVVADDTFEV